MCASVSCEGVAVSVRLSTYPFVPLFVFVFLYVYLSVGLSVPLMCDSHAERHWDVGGRYEGDQQGGGRPVKVCGGCHGLLRRFQGHQAQERQGWDSFLLNLA